MLQGKLVNNLFFTSTMHKRVMRGNLGVLPSKTKDPSFFFPWVSFKDLSFFSFFSSLPACTRGEEELEET
jgi:hypothetical protein